MATKNGGQSSNEVVLRVDGFEERLPDVASRFAEEWRTRGWLTDGALRLTSAEWVSLGAPTEGTLEPDEHDYWVSEWAAEHDGITAAVGIRPERIELEMVGYFGAPSARIRVTLDGREVQNPAAVLASSAPASPFVAWVCSRVAELPSRDRRGQLRRWAEVRYAISNHLPRLKRPPVVEVDDTLSAIEPTVADRFRLKWQPDNSNSQLLSLKAEAVGRDGAIVPIDYNDFDPRGIVASDARKPVLVPDDVAKVLAVAATKTRRARRELGEELNNPAVLIPEGVEADRYFDLTEYSERVLGFELVQRKEAMEDPKGSGIDWFGDRGGSGEPFIEIIVDSGTAAGVLTIPLATEEEARKLYDDNEAALTSGRTEPIAAGTTAVHPNPRISEQLKPVLGLEEKPLAGSNPAPRGIYAAVVKELEAAETVDADGVIVDEHIVPWDVLSNLLRDGTQLKPHQRRGIAWMWGHLKSSTPGVLLADDMGLGKTLQASSFLALRAAENPEGRHLIVAPTVLLENWATEIEKFFRPGVLSDRVLLHGETLRRALDSGGSLNEKYVESHQLVVTNYESLARHQKSLLKIDFDVVVFDEAHNVKNATTLKARAARALKRKFALAMTGTPVETTLSDVWAIYDATQTEQPRVFGTAPEFESEFTQRGGEGIAALRKRLAFPSSKSSLLRREKREALRDLPPKSIVARHAEMTPRQVEQERAIIASMGKRGALAALEGFRKLYQHPSLLESGPVRMTSDEALSVSPKTRLCLSILDEIAASGEKALVFTLRYQMQDLLVQLLMQHFRLPRVHIINGDPRNRKAAQQKIADFSNSKGFDVMILSPIAAGVGLTITAANHVIHYERWWNPAKEDQATDRAYRIGQTRPVTVYYPVLHRPGAMDEGFDVRLHQLVEARRSVARDFLAPADELETTERDLKKLFLEERT